MPTTNSAEDKRKAGRRRMRWVIYPGLVVLVTIFFGVCALSYLGTFSHLRTKPFPPAVMRALQAQRLALNIASAPTTPVASDPYLTVYANPQAYTAYWKALRSGNHQQRSQLEHSGRVIALPQGTLIWYQSKSERELLTPVHLLGSRYVGRTYWVTNSDFS
jgi:hypothetical protein